MFEELLGISVSEWSVSDPAQLGAILVGILVGMVLAAIIESLWPGGRGRKGRR